MKKNFPLLLVFIYACIFIWSSINPIDIPVWKVEALTSLVPIAFFTFLYFKGTRFSNLAYLLFAIFPLMHIIGAHYTFANVPFDWFNNLIGSERNMYDRVAHFSVGFYSFGIVEILLMKKLVNKKWIAYLFALFTIISIAAIYELFEWWYAVSADPQAGIEVLGSQGDIWDAQKDILMDTIGSIIGIGLFMIFGKKEMRK